MPPLRVLVALLLGAVLARISDRRQWRRAEASLSEAATLWGDRLRDQDAREDRMALLAERQLTVAARQLYLGRVSLFVAMVALLLAAREAL